MNPPPPSTIHEAFRSTITSSQHKDLATRAFDRDQGRKRVLATPKGLRPQPLPCHKPRRSALFAGDHASVIVNGRHRSRRALIFSGMASNLDIDIRIPLVVDLDGTLLLTDSLHEGFANL